MSWPSCGCGCGCARLAGVTTDAQVRIIQVGAGSMGRGWLRLLGRTPGVQLVGLVDLDVEVARSAAADTGQTACPVASSLADLLGRVGADAVVNVTVPEAHRSVSLAALGAGLPVLCEKPAAATVAEALSMAAAADESGRLLMISQSRRYWRTLTQFKRVLADLGPVGSLDCQFYRAPHFGGFRDVMAQPLLGDMAIHQFDLARHLLDDDPVAVYCETFNPSWSWYAGDASAVAVFEFAAGARFTFTGSWCAPGLETSWNGSWRAGAEAGTTRWDGEASPVVGMADAGRPGPALPPLDDTEPEEFEGSLAAFLAALRSGSTPATEIHANVVSLAMVEAAVRSADRGERVLIADVLADAAVEASRLDPRPR